MTSKIEIESNEIYTSVSANSQENSISCAGRYLLYSRSNCPVLYDTEQGRVTSILIGHSGQVNNQHFVDTSFSDQETSDQIYLISTSHDKTAIVWQFDSKLLTSKILHQFTAPNESSFTATCSFRDEESNFISITTSIDCSICLWVNAEPVYILETRYCCFEAKFFALKVDGINYKFLFLAGSDNKIRVFQINSKNLEFLFELLGHSDWIKCIDVSRLADRTDEFLVASSSQDSYIRVWHMKLVNSDLDLSQQIRTTVSKPLQVSCDQKSRLTATLETVLSGHEGIVYGLCWFKKSAHPILQLISCSADKTVILWRSAIASPQGSQNQQQPNKYEQCPASEGVWQQVQRFGETGETNLPFLGVCLSEDESIFYALSLRGAIHSWHIDKETSSWLARPAILGHFGPITDLSWEKSGAYLLSASLDKTCRLHAISSKDQDWHELARPQVHGHEINCLVSIDPIRFATGAEEKTVRIFRATQFFLKNFKFLASASLELDGQADNLPIHAQLPALGLSNKGACSPYGDVKTSGDADQESGPSSNWYAVSKLVEHLAEIDHLESPPIEEILLQSTLWVETHKLFGHGNELHALAVDSTGSYLASATKANCAELANVIIWDCAKFRKNTTIQHHTLTVTRLRFSPNDRYLLSISRDRTWCLSERTGNPKPSYAKFINTTKINAVHERIIWDCCWTCDSQYFVTVSRDKKAILWSLDQLREQANVSDQNEDQQHNNLSPLLIEPFDCSIQAVDSPGAPMQRKESRTYHLLAFGLENGSLELHSVSVDSMAGSRPDWQRIKLISNYHHLPIRRLAFKPISGVVICDQQSRSEDELDSQMGSITGDQIQFILASGSDDCIVKLTQFSISLT